MMGAVEPFIPWKRFFSVFAYFTLLLIVFGILHLMVALTAGETETALQEIFRDDFDEHTLNLTRWNPADTKSFVNNELQYYRPDNVRLVNGTLGLVSRREEYGDCGYTSGRVDTRGKFSFRHGEIEWRARIPTGRGMWPALWLAHPQCVAARPCGEFWPPAISVIDVRGQEPNVIVSTVFYNTGGQDQSPVKTEKQVDMKQDMSADFHVYKLIWTAEALLWFVDGALVLSVTGAEKVPTVALQVVMNVAVGGYFSGSPDNSTEFPTEFLIDYVVVRQGDIDVSPWVNITAVTRENSPVVTIVLGSLVGVLVFTVIVVLIGCVFWKQRQRLRRGDMRKGPDSLRLTTKSSLACHIKAGYEQVDQAIQHYVKLLEISITNVEIGAVLGKGEHGIVRRGVATGLRGQPLPTLVAIKMVRNTNDPEQNRQIIQEMKVMTKAGRHLNITNLLGAVFKDETFLLLEYSEHGSLLRYLQRHRNVIFHNCMDPSPLLANSEAGTVCSQQLTNMETSASIEDEGMDGRALSTGDLISFTFQISRGMAFLSSRSIIHRDLAARNILVCPGGVVKIADFGMARQLSEYVLLNERVALPVRWMVPESIWQRTFSHKSDVWSFGVLTWEIYSLGETPHTSAALNAGNATDFLTALLAGHYMERPPVCPSAVYDIMLHCWRLRPVERPAFSQLEQELTHLVGRNSAQNYLLLDKPYEQFNVTHQDLLADVVDESSYVFIGSGGNPFG